MKLWSSRNKRRLFSAVIALSAAALLLLSVTALSTSAMAEQNLSNDTESAALELSDDSNRADAADENELMRLPLNDQGRGMEFSDHDLPEEDNPEPESETEPTRRPAPSGRRSVNTDPTTAARTTTASTTEAPTSSKAPQQTKARVLAPAVTTAPRVTEAPRTTVPPRTTAAPKTTQAPTTTQAPKTTAAPTPAPTKAPTPQVSGSFNRASCDEFIALLNQYRAANGVGALQRSGQLTGIAEKRAVEIVNDFSHAGISKYGNYGENIFMGAGADRYNYASTALTAFQNSPGHDTNQLYAAYNFVGVGHYITPSGAHYWAVVFSF
ncbi:MAG: CAP domain-containing protein [Eubacteriales bacterium]|nr:CAP domain-containing protein [Eubacteriales bacterium]MDD4323864.1 CAP domain-containing protein [Eubacteriales bacterium]MDD4541054.1 CAP domain-containing protein [Eubacteriales bacterium]